MSEPNTPRYSIVIPFYNNREIIPTCVPSIKELYEKYENIIKQTRTAMPIVIPSVSAIVALCAGAASEDVGARIAVIFILTLGLYLLILPPLFVTT